MRVLRNVATHKHHAINSFSYFMLVKNHHVFLLDGPGWSDDLLVAFSRSKSHPRYQDVK